MSVLLLVPRVSAAECRELLSILPAERGGARHDSRRDPVDDVRWRCVLIEGIGPTDSVVVGFGSWLILSVLLSELRLRT